MPTLPLQIGATPLQGGTLPVTSSADVLAVLPAFLKPSDPAPVRDGLIAALTAIMQNWQSSSSYAAWQSDVLHAEDTYLNGLLEDRGVPRAPSESDATYRARGIGIPSLVTPSAILAGVNAILAPFTPIQAQYFESVLDRWYVRKAPSAATFHSFVWQTGSSIGKRSPFYPDRLYEDDAVSNGGFTRPQSSPGGARVFNDQAGRYLIIRIPDLSSLNASFVTAFRTANDIANAALAVPWVALAAYTVGSYVTPPTPNGFFYQYTAGPTSSPPTHGATPPVFPVPGNIIQSVVEGLTTLTLAGALNPVGSGMFINKHASAGNYGSFVRAVGASPIALYNAVAKMVDRLRAGSIRFRLVIDPKMS